MKLFSLKLRKKTLVSVVLFGGSGFNFLTDKPKDVSKEELKKVPDEFGIVTIETFEGWELTELEKDIEEVNSCLLQHSLLKINQHLRETNKTA